MFLLKLRTHHGNGFAMKIIRTQEIRPPSCNQSDATGRSAIHYQSILVVFSDMIIQCRQVLHCNDELLPVFVHLVRMRVVDLESRDVPVSSWRFLRAGRACV